MPGHGCHFGIHTRNQSAGRGNGGSWRTGSCSAPSWLSPVHSSPRKANGLQMNLTMPTSLSVCMHRSNRSKRCCTLTNPKNSICRRHSWSCHTFANKINQWLKWLSNQVMIWHTVIKMIEQWLWYTWIKQKVIYKPSNLVTWMWILHQSPREVVVFNTRCWITCPIIEVQARPLKILVCEGALPPNHLETSFGSSQKEHLSVMCEASITIMNQKRHLIEPARANVLKLKHTHPPRVAVMAVGNGQQGRLHHCCSSYFKMAKRACLWVACEHVRVLASAYGSHVSMWESLLASAG